jgi:hypothetical protein
VTGHGDTHQLFEITMLRGMFSLPDPHGQFPVGSTTFVLQVQSPFTVGSSKLRNSESNRDEPALVLKEVAFTAFYPAKLESSDGKVVRKGLDWLIRWENCPVKKRASRLMTHAGQPRKLCVATHIF